jgi:hypothetical protein
MKMRLTEKPKMETNYRKNIRDPILNFPWKKSRTMHTNEAP